jgi:basic membrane protein A and related proteins
MRSSKRARLATVGLALSMALVAAACGDDDEEGTAVTGAATTAAPAETTAAPSETTAAPGGDTTAAPGGDTTAAPAEPAACAQGDVTQVGIAFDAIGRGDGSFNDAAAAGLDRTKAELGFEVSEQVPAADGSDRADKLDLLANEGFNPVIAVGFLFSDPLDQVAPDFADTCFGVIDSVVDQPNVAGLVFAEHEGSFLVGAAAALKSESGTIGFVGGLEGDLIKRFEAGYTAGAKQVNPDINVLVGYAGSTVDAFNDPAKGNEIAKGQIDGGADIVYHAAGQTGLGVFQAVKEANDAGNTVWAIGVDSDQGSPDNKGVPNEVKPYILTSMLKRVDVAVEETINAVNDGTFAAGVQVFDLARDGVGYSVTGGHIDDIVTQLDELKEQIISGEITVPEAP